MMGIALRVCLGAAVGFMLAVAGCATAPSGEGETRAAAAVADDPVGRRRADLLVKLRGMSPEEFPAANPLGALLRGDAYEGPLDAGRAVEAYAAGEFLKALLFAQASVGADPGNSARRTLMHTIATESGLTPDPEGELPRPALVRYELSRASRAFFEERFGEALQRARRAVALEPDSSAAWQAKGSAEFALDDYKRARASYEKAASLAPDDAHLARFLAERGWSEKENAPD